MIDIDNIVNTYHIFEELESSTDINKKTWFVGGMISIFLLLYTIIGMEVITNLTGFVYPAYKTWKYIDSKDNEEKNKWLFYWFLFSSIMLMETITNLLFLFIPFYYQLKLLFLVWLFHDSTRGSEIIYERYFKQLLKNIDNKKYVVNTNPGKKNQDNIETETNVINLSEKEKKLL